MAVGSALTTAAQRVDGRYRIVDLLGKGAMGAVYRVVDETTNRELALKRLLSPGRGSQVGLRFRREFHTIAGLSHPGIVEVHDFGVDDEGPYYTMELLEGGDLREMTGCDIVEICTMMRQIAGALALLHAHRLLHRDLKPRNVRCTAEGKPKLIDFGVLATIGISGEVAGTPSSIPPEALRGLPVDGRSDLFGLGALTYWMLTGRHAFPAKAISELEGVWRRDIAPPSAYRKNVSPALDELVMSLLSLDPSGRPTDAAEVVARFDAVGELEPDPTLDVARGWITSAALVGRDRELNIIRSAVHNAMKSKGGGVLIEGGSGLGKTRLLREAGLVGQVAGAVVARARARLDANEPYAVVRRIASELIGSCRGEAEEALAGLGAALRVVPDLSGVRPLAMPEPLPDPAEERLRGQAAIREWFRRVTERRALVVLIDDLQRCDEASAAVIAGLVDDAPGTCLMLCASVRTDEAALAPSALQMIGSRSERIALSGLDEAGVEQLCRTLFGDAEGIDRLSRWMRQVARGNPMHCTELARHLVEQEVLNYAQGQWQVPAEFDELSLPAVLAEAVEVRLGRLRPLARELAEALSLADGRVGLGLCLSLLPDADPEETIDALRELVFEEVVLEGDRGVEFRHDALKESVRAKIDHANLAELHLRLAEAIETTSRNDRALDNQVGWHYLRGGRRIKGAAFLERAGRKLYESHSFSDALRPLEAALEVWQEQPKLRKRCLDLRHLLTRCGVICDRAVVLKHADEAIAAYSSDAGLDYVPRIRWLVGVRLAVLACAAFAFVRWAFSRSYRVRPVEALTGTLALVNYAASVHSLGYDAEPVERLLDRVRPLAGFKNRVPEGGFLLVQNFLHLALGDFIQVVRNADHIVNIVESDRVTPLADIDRMLARGAAEFMAASVLALDQDPAAAPYLDGLKASNLRFFEMSAYNIEAFQQRLRGNEPKARELVARSELLGVQLGNAWVFRSQMSWISAIAYGLTGDVLGMDRTLDELERYRDEGYKFDPWIAYLRAEQLRLRGEFDACFEQVDQGEAMLRDDELIVRQLLTAARVDALNAMREHEAAIEHASGLLERGEGASEILRTVELRVGCARAVARAAVGDFEEAKRDLSSRLSQADAMDSPMMTGLVHEALTVAARHAGDESVERHHARRAAAIFGQAGTVVLQARGRKLLSNAGESQSGTGEAGDSNSVSSSSSHADVSATRAPRLDEEMEETVDVARPASPTEP